MKLTKLNVLLAAGALCLLPVTALDAADPAPGAEQPAEVPADETMCFAVVVAKGGG